MYLELVTSDCTNWHNMIKVMTVLVSSILEAIFETTKDMREEKTGVSYYNEMITQKEHNHAIKGPHKAIILHVDKSAKI